MATFSTPGNGWADGEPDNEPNLEHTQFRQLSSAQGRWLSPDPYMGSMDLTNPRSLNRYAYVTNSPLNAVDPTGLDQANPGFCPAEFENCDGGGASGGGGAGGGGGVGGGDPCLGGDGTGCIPFPFPIPIPFPINPGGGSGGGVAPAPSAPSAQPNVNPSGKPPLSGETLGIPNSIHLHLPSILQTLGLAPNDPACDFIACGTNVGDSLQGPVTTPVEVWVGLGALANLVSAVRAGSRIAKQPPLFPLPLIDPLCTEGYKADMAECREKHLDDPVKREACYAQAAQNLERCISHLPPGPPLP